MCSVAMGSGSHLLCLRVVRLQKRRAPRIPFTFAFTFIFVSTKELDELGLDLGSGQGAYVM